MKISQWNQLESTRNSAIYANTIHESSSIANDWEDKDTFNK